MKIKHWKVKEDLGDFYVVDEDGENVVLTHCLDEKDAHLIAVAPEMLNELISQYEQICNVCNYNLSCDINPCQRKKRLQDTIRKATGYH
jgi:hypothetical protein